MFKPVFDLSGPPKKDRTNWEIKETQQHMMWKCSMDKTRVATGVGLCEALTCGIRGFMLKVDNVCVFGASNGHKVQRK